MKQKPEIVDIEYDEHKSEADTDKAHLFVIDGEDIWIPKSICEIDEDDSTITIPFWFARDNGLV